MHNPPHPGLLVRKSIMDKGAGLTITEAAAALGISRLSLSKLVNGRCGISPEMAIRLSIALNTSSELWLNMQRMYDLWESEKNRAALLKQVKVLKKIKSHEIQKAS